MEQSKAKIGDTAYFRIDEEKCAIIGHSIIRKITHKGVYLCNKEEDGIFFPWECITKIEENGKEG